MDFGAHKRNMLELRQVPLRIHCGLVSLHLEETPQPVAFKSLCC